VPAQVKTVEEKKAPVIAEEVKTEEIEEVYTEAA